MPTRFVRAVLTHVPRYGMWVTRDRPSTSGNPVAKRLEATRVLKQHAAAAVTLTRKGVATLTTYVPMYASVSKPNKLKLKLKPILFLRRSLAQLPST